MERFSGEPGFLTRLSHDLRAPLNGILGFAALLHEGKVGPLSAGQRECLADVLASANEMLRLVNELSAVGKLESDPIEPDPAPVDLVALLGDVRASLGLLSASRQIQVTQDVDARLTGVVADPARLRQLIASCAAYAVTATRAGGHLTIRATVQDPRRFRIEVADTSHGVHASPVLSVVLPRTPEAAGGR